MRRTGKTTAACLAAVTTLALLSACGSEEEPEAAVEATSEAPAEESAEPEPTETEAEEAEEADEAEEVADDEEAEEGDSEKAAGGSGDVAAPGDTAGFGEWLSLPYEAPGDDGGSAVVDVTVTKVAEAPGADQKALQKEISQLKGMTVYYVWADMKKNSGDDIAYGSIASEFYPVDADKQRVQDISLIGWDSCPSESFTEEFDAGETLSTCFAAAVPDSQPAPAGGAWSDLEDYNVYDDQALYWVK